MTDYLEEAVRQLRQATRDNENKIRDLAHLNYTDPGRRDAERERMEIIAAWTSIAAIKAGLAPPGACGAMLASPEMAPDGTGPDGERF